MGPLVAIWTALNGLAYRLASWIDGQVEARPSLENALEDRLHRYGLHGPFVRHELHVYLLPAMLGVLVLAFLVAAGLTRLTMWLFGRRARARRRLRAAARAAAR